MEAMGDETEKITKRKLMGTKTEKQKRENRWAQKIRQTVQYCRDIVFKPRWVS